MIMATGPRFNPFLNHAIEQTERIIESQCANVKAL